MLLMIDNYDSFTYNLYHMVAKNVESVEVVRNDVLSVDKLLESLIVTKVEDSSNCESRVIVDSIFSTGVLSASESKGLKVSIITFCSISYSLILFVYVIYMLSCDI